MCPPNGSCYRANQGLVKFRRHFAWRVGGAGVAGETRGYFGVDVKAGPRGRGKVGVLEGEVGV